MSRLLNQKLQELRQRVVTIAQTVQQALTNSVAALTSADAEAARIVRQRDQAINDQRFSLEGDTATVIATQQPVAGDVRLLVGILEIAAELERMGDYAKDIARIAIQQAEYGTPKTPAGIAQMAEHAESMLERAVKAFVAGDAQLADAVARDDDDIDELCSRLHRELVKYAQAGETALEEALRLMSVVHNIERFADRVTNICERIIYIATGEQIEFDARDSQ